MYTLGDRSPDSTVALAGWSEERQQYETYRISNWDKNVEGHPDVPAYTLVPLDGFWSNTGPDGDLEDMR